MFKTRDFHHLKAVQIACERYGGLGERDRLVRARQASCQGDTWQIGERLVDIPGPRGDLWARRIGEEGALKNSPSLLPCRA